MAGVSLFRQSAADSSAFSRGPPHIPLQEHPPGQPMQRAPRFFARYRYLPERTRMIATTARMMQFSIPLLPFAQRVLRRKLFVGIPNQSNHDGSQKYDHNQTRQESGTERAGGNQRTDLIGKIRYRKAGGEL